MKKTIWENIRWEVHKNTLTFVLLVIVGGTAPLWIGLLVTASWNNGPDFTHFLQKGELYLFSAAFYTHAIYLLFEHKKKNYDFMAVTGWFSGLFLLISAVIYGNMITPAEILNSDSRLNIHFIFISSIICFAFSVIALYIGMYKDNEKKEPLDVAVEIREEVEDIKNQIS